jgi:hypothetical protein
MCSFQFLNQLTDIHQTQYELYAFGDHPNVILNYFLQIVITTWLLREHVRWEHPLHFTLEVPSVWNLDTA